MLRGKTVRANREATYTNIPLQSIFSRAGRKQASKSISLVTRQQSCSSHSILYISSQRSQTLDSKENMAMAKFIKRRSSVLKHAVRVMQRSLLPVSKMKTTTPSIWGYLSDEFEEGDGTGVVPEDVKEGHFAVVAVLDEKPKRFVVSLSCLSHPMFLKLLELAEEEFGFQHEGALAIPCRPSDLEKIIREL